MTDPGGGGWGSATASYRGSTVVQNTARNLQEMSATVHLTAVTALSNTESVPHSCRFTGMLNHGPWF